MCPCAWCWQRFLVSCPADSPVTGLQRPTFRSPPIDATGVGAVTAWPPSGAPASAPAAAGGPRAQCDAGARKGGSHAARSCLSVGVQGQTEMADEVGAASGLGSGVCREEATAAATGGEPGMCACGRPTERISVTVKPTTGGQFAVTAASDDSVDYLKLLVSQKLKVPKERICLLYRNR